MEIQCPKCGFSQSDTNVECLRCGVIFEKIGITPKQIEARDGRAASEAKIVRRTPERGPRRAQDRTAQRSHGLAGTDVAAAGILAKGMESRRSAQADHFSDGDIEDTSVFTSDFEDEADVVPETRHMDRDDWVVLGAGLLITVVVVNIPLLNHIFRTLGVLVHEMGHFIVGWIFAYPSVPAFDLRYGGGVTIHAQRSFVLLICIYAGMAFLFYTYRKNTSTLILLSILFAVHVVCSATAAHEVIILFMGHGTELVIAGIFFYRALSGAAVVHSVERPLYGAISFFLVYHDIRFAYRLMTSMAARQEYQDAKGGGHWMDFSRIAEDFLYVDLTSVAFVFLLACLLPLILGFLTFRYQEYIRKAIVHLWTREPSQATGD